MREFEKKYLLSKIAGGQRAHISTGIKKYREMRRSNLRRRGPVGRRRRRRPWEKKKKKTKSERKS